MTTIKATIRRRYTAVGASAPATAAGSFTNGPASLTPSTRVITSSPATVATGSGGTGSYTFTWARISGSAAISATSPSAASTTFSATVGVDANVVAVFRVTVSDGITSATADVTVTLSYNSGF